MSGDIFQGMHASNVVCVHKLDVIHHDLQASFTQRRPTKYKIIKGLHTFDVSSAHRQATSLNDMFHQSRHACIYNVTRASALRNLHRSLRINMLFYMYLTWNVNFGQWNASSVNKHWSWSTHISCVLCTLLNRPRPWMACILHIT